MNYKHIAVIGLGSGGSAVADMLAKAGVAELILIDPDVLTEDNCKRHMLSLDDVGKNKALAMAEHLALVAPHCKVYVQENMFGERKRRINEVPWDFCSPSARRTEEEYNHFSKKPDIIVSCVDSLACESRINAYSLEHKIPTVYGCVRGAARAAEILYVIPGKTPCFDCYGRSGPVTEPGQEQYIDPIHDPTKMPSMKGLWGDVLMAASMQFQVVLGILGERKLPPKPLTIFTIHNTYVGGIDHVIQKVWVAEYFDTKKGCAVCSDNIDNAPRLTF
jgi:molybdopterin/thiamine biosynthesis adenylyltransferase